MPDKEYEHSKELDTRRLLVVDIISNHSAEKYRLFLLNEDGTIFTHYPIGERADYTKDTIMKVYNSIDTEKQFLEMAKKEK